MKKYTFVLLCIVAVTTLAACTMPVSGDIIKSDKQRITATTTNTADQNSLVNDNTGFAFDLYQVLRKENANLFFSPYSISEALTMTYAGAKNTTMQQMAKTLHFNLTGNSLHAAFNNLDQELQNRGKGAKGKDGKGFRLNIVNATWGQKNYTFQTDYLDTLAQYYGAGIRLLDFKNASEESRTTINNWVSEQTENRIKDLIQKGSITQATRLVLTNAIYFNAAWQSQFNKESTSPGTFKKLDGQTVSVSMMRQTTSFNYGESSDYQIIELPYDGQELSMVIMLPKENKFNELDQALTAQKLKSLLSGMIHKRVNLSMPKFKIESSFGLKETLLSMGMVDAFNPGNADFSGITGKKDLFISDVVHKSFVAVDENGTEAAASTAVIMGLTAMPAQPITMTIDKPFIFLIKDKTGAVLFLGRVLIPES